MWHKVTADLSTLTKMKAEEVEYPRSLLLTTVLKPWQLTPIITFLYYINKQCKKWQLSSPFQLGSHTCIVLQKWIKNIRAKNLTG